MVGRVVEVFRTARWLNARRLRVYPTLFIIVIVLSNAWTMYAHRILSNVGADFVTFHAASALTLRGHPAQAYDKAHQLAAETATLDRIGRHSSSARRGYDGFYYPPTFLVVIEPLAEFSYWKAFLLFIALTMGGYVLVMRGIAQDWSALWLLAFPGVWVDVLTGQNGMLTLTLLGGGLLLLETRPVAAGALFGLLTYKPQFGLLIPLVLLAGRRWRVIAVAAFGAAAFALLSVALFGIGPWRAFFSSVPWVRRVVLEQGGTGFGKLQSTFAAVRLLGGSVALGYAVQTAVSLAAGAIVLWLWLRPIPYSLKAAALVAGTLLVTPYLFDYDLVLLGLPIAWQLQEARQSGFLSWEKILLGLIWLFPLFARGLAMLGSVPLAPLVLSLMLLLVVRRAVASTSAAGQAVPPGSRSSAIAKAARRLAVPLVGST